MVGGGGGGGGGYLPIYHQYCSSSRKVFPDWSTNCEGLQRLQPNKIAYAASHVLLLRVTLEKIHFTAHLRDTCVTFLTTEGNLLHCTAVGLPIDWKEVM